MYYFRTRFLLSPMYPRHRKYRSPLLTQRPSFDSKKFNRSIYLNTRTKATNKSRYTYLRLNADVRKHNSKGNVYKC